MEISIIILICAVVAFGIAVAILSIALLRKSDKGTKVDGVKVIDGVRYTKDEHVLDESGAMNITHNKNDIVLECNKEYKCVKDGKLMPGKYVVLSTDANSDAFNIRLSGLVREYKHNSEIVIAENDVICAVSHAVILR